MRGQILRSLGGLHGILARCRVSEVGGISVLAQFRDHRVGSPGIFVVAQALGQLLSIARTLFQVAEQLACGACAALFQILCTALDVLLQLVQYLGFLGGQAFHLFLLPVVLSQLLSLLHGSLLHGCIQGHVTR